MRFKIVVFATSLLLVVGCELMYTDDSVPKIYLSDASVSDVGTPDTGADPGLDANTSDAELPDVGTPDTGADPGLDAGQDASTEPPDATSTGEDASTEPPDASSPGPDAGQDASTEPPDASSPGPDAGDLCVPDPCNGHGTCNPLDGSCSCNGDWSGPDCATCPAGFGGTSCLPLATLSVMPVSGALTQLFATSLQVLKWRISCSGASDCYVPRQTVGYQFAGSGSWQVVGQELYVNGVASTASLARVSGRVLVVGGAPEEIVSSGTYNEYLFYLTISGSGVSGDTLTVTLLGDPAPAPSMVGSTGRLYGTSGSVLYSAASGLCSADAPNFVWVGVPHTPRTLSCPLVADSGPPDYSTGFEVVSWSPVQNVLTAP